MRRWVEWIPALDFAGGTVVHIASGFSALVCAIYLGKRLGYPEGCHGAAQPCAECYRRLHALGGLVWIQRRKRVGCWRAATSAFVATHFAAATGHWDGWRPSGSDRKTYRARSDLRRCVRPGWITPASGFVTPMPAAYRFHCGCGLLPDGDGG